MTCDQGPVLLLQLPGGFEQLQLMVAPAGHWPI